MLAHTFRGSSIKSMLGLESDRKVFERYRAIRSAERVYRITLMKSVCVRARLRPFRNWFQ